MSSLCLSCRSYILEPRLQAIVSKLLQLIKSPSPEVHAESLNALASVAITSKDLFSTYYDSVITSLKKLLDDATSKSVQNNTVKLHLDNAVECIWTVAIAVGKDIFKKDAAEVMVLLLSVRLSLGEDNHSAKLTLLRAWDQLLQCLGSDFYPYMEDLIPDLLRSARLGSDSGTERVILTEKLRACELLLRLARQFKGMFSPWIDQVSETLIPLVTFHDEDIRKIAVSAMPRLLLSAKLAIETKEAPGLTNSHSHKLVVQIVPSLLEALDEETDGKNCAKILRSLTKCIEIAGAFLSKEQIQLTATGIEQVLEATSESHFSKEETVTELEKEIIKEVRRHHDL
ncbi:importin-5 [Capsicum annuum]|uniref:importin-5 n=1 Tax=Capsicum annuum TaxID=4072 RepID=UPI001FB13513|nr:importin-5 [Capsicum annuum]